MNIVVWDGTTRCETLNDWAKTVRVDLADAAKAFNWPRVLDVLSEHRDFVNASRPGGKSLYSPLHQAAYGGASLDVVERLIAIGAWRTLQNARGERPLDVATRRSHDALLSALEPVLRRHVPIGVLLKIQSHFHDVIRGRVDRLVQQHGLRLPELESLLEIEQPQMWFAVPGMYGGFRYRLDSAGVEAKLVSESWCRVSEGSGQRHEITSEGSRLVDEGFV